MPNLIYPKGIQDLDNDAPFTLIFDEYERFQVCHTFVKDTMFFVIIIRILDSRIDSSTQMITLSGIEFMVIHGFDKNVQDYEDSGMHFTLDCNDVTKSPPVELFHSDQDDEYHKASLLNFKVKLTKVKDLPMPRAVYKYLVPVKIDVQNGERLHFVCELDGQPIPDTGNFKNQMCQVNIAGKSVWVTYDQKLKMGK
jgi:hypothetical protein